VLNAQISEAHRRSVVGMRGQAGLDWLAALPELIAWCEQEWSFSLTRPVADLWFNFVAHGARHGGTDVVLKLCPPFEPETATEIAALRHFAGRGSIEVLAADVARGALLLEAAKPGIQLERFGDEDQQVRVSAEVMRRLWRAAPQDHPFPSVAEWAGGIKRLLRRRFDGGTGPLASSLVERAEALFAELLASQGEQVLLHGDLHWENILSAEREPWLAIDPKGVVGEPAYEVGPLLRNGLPRGVSSAEARRVLARRIDILVEALDFAQAARTRVGVRAARPVRGVGHRRRRRDGEPLGPVRAGPIRLGPEGTPYEHVRAQHTVSVNEVELIERAARARQDKGRDDACPRARGEFDQLMSEFSVRIAVGW
jgi:streptomycin 6-kinase